MTKTEVEMAERQAAIVHDEARSKVLNCARVFKQSWLELAGLLSKVESTRKWETWGYKDFDSYCRKELHLKSATVAKLLGSYRFLESSAPRVIDRASKMSSASVMTSGSAPAQSTSPAVNVPSLDAVQFIEKARALGHAPQKVLQEMESFAYDDGAEVSALSRKYKAVAFPMQEERAAHPHKALIAASKRVIALLAESPQLPPGVAERVEVSIGALLEAIEMSN